VGRWSREKGYLRVDLRVKLRVMLRVTNFWIAETRKYFPKKNIKKYFDR